MYKTIESGGWPYEKRIELHKDYNKTLHFPRIFKIMLPVFLALIATVVLLGTLVDPGAFFLFIFMIVPIAVSAIMSDGDIKQIKPHLIGISSDVLSEEDSYRTVTYKLLSQLHDVMQIDEVDNFSDRQALAADVYNLIKVARANSRIAKNSDLEDAYKKLVDIEEKALNDRKEIESAGMHKETPALDLAADIARGK